MVGPPHGGVKEQGPGVYAQELARRGFVAIGFDPSYNGESSGQPRHVTSPEIFAEDFSAGVDYLGTLPYVDRDRIGAIGICGSGGFALSAASVDPRIKAVATAAMYDISGVKRDGWQHSGTDEARRQALSDAAAQRWADVDAGEPTLSPTFPAEIPDGLGPDHRRVLRVLRDRPRPPPPLHRRVHPDQRARTHQLRRAPPRRRHLAPPDPAHHRRPGALEVVQRRRLRAGRRARKSSSSSPAPGTSTSTTAPT